MQSPVLRYYYRLCMFNHVKSLAKQAIQYFHVFLILQNDHTIWAITLSFTIIVSAGPSLMLWCRSKMHFCHIILYILIHFCTQVKHITCIFILNLQIWHNNITCDFHFCWGYYNFVVFCTDFIVFLSLDEQLMGDGVKRSFWLA